MASTPNKFWQTIIKVLIAALSALAGAATQACTGFPL